MKKFTLVLITCLFCSAIAFAQKKTTAPQRLKYSLHFGKSKARAQVKPTKGKNMRILAESNTRWEPTHEKEYFYMDGAWEAGGDYYYTYDGKGNVLSFTYSDEEGKVRTTYTYNENNKVVRQLEETAEPDGEFVKSSLNEKEYDPQVPSLVVRNDNYYWDEVAQDWVPSFNCYKREVVRDADGNVTQVDVLLFYEGAYENNQRITVTYADGKATTYRQEAVEDFEADGTPVWSEYVYLTDIEWENTDGQIVWDWDVLFEGDNRIKLANVMDGDIVIGTIKAVYTAGKPDYVLEIHYPADEMNTAELNRVTMRQKDENGSYSYESALYSDDNEDGKFAEEELYDCLTVIEYFNDHGSQVLYEEFMLGEDGKMQQSGGTRTTYTYGEEHGERTGMVVEEWEEEYDEDGMPIGGGYVPYFRIVADEHTEITAIRPIGGAGTAELQHRVDGSTLAFSMAGMRSYTLYNLQGVPVVQGRADGEAAINLNHCPAGAYILKAEGAQGSVKTVRVLK